MASYRIAPIDKFDFSKPKQWGTWIRQFKRFRIVSGLQAKTNEEQISTLIYSLGDRAKDFSFEMSFKALKNFVVLKLLHNAR